MCYSALESRASELAIDSDILQVNQNSNHAIFRGNVVVNFKDMQLKADLMEVFYEQGDKQSVSNPKAQTKIDKIVIPGKLKATKPCEDEIVIADRGVYEARQNKLTLTGNVILSKGSNIIKTNKAIYYTNFKSSMEDSRK